MLGVGFVSEHRQIATFQVAGTFAGECRHRVLTAALGQEPQGGHGEIVVGLVEDVPTGFGDRIHPRRAATTTRRRGHEGGAFAGFQQAVGLQRIQMTTDPRGCHAEPLRQLRGGRGAVGQQGTRHTAASL